MHQFPLSHVNHPLPPQKHSVKKIKTTTTTLFGCVLCDYVSCENYSPLILDSCLWRILKLCVVKIVTSGYKFGVILIAIFFFRKRLSFRFLEILRTTTTWGDE